MSGLAEKRVRIDGRWNRRGKDIMGYSLKSALSQFTETEIAAARRLSAHAGFEWDTVGTDPRVFGWRFLKAAHIVLRGTPPMTASEWEALNLNETRHAE